MSRLSRMMCPMRRTIGLDSVADGFQFLVQWRGKVPAVVEYGIQAAEEEQ